MSHQQPAMQMAALVAEHPGIHPYTLALLWQQRSGQQLSGRQVRHWLQEKEPGSVVTGYKQGAASNR